jgi:hypothetical protein
MDEITITGDLAARIREAAREAQQSIEEFLEDAYQTALADRVLRGKASFPDEPEPGTSGALLRSARRANIRTGQTDTSERMREILDQEWYEHLTRYRHEQDSEDE